MSVDRIIASIPDKMPEERQRMRRNAEEKRETGASPVQDDARRLLDALDEFEGTEQAALYARLKVMPVSARVVEAFRHQPPTETEEKLLRVLLDNPGSTSAELSRALGWGAQSWHMHFGKMCQAREVRLWPAERVEKRDSSFFSGILADFDNNRSTFTMKPEVAGALGELGIRAKAKA